MTCSNEDIQQDNSFAPKLIIGRTCHTYKELFRLNFDYLLLLQIAMKARSREREGDRLRGEEIERVSERERDS